MTRINQMLLTHASYHCGIQYYDIAINDEKSCKCKPIHYFWWYLLTISYIYINRSETLVPDVVGQQRWNIASGLDTHIAC